MERRFAPRLPDAGEHRGRATLRRFPRTCSALNTTKIRSFPREPREAKFPWQVTFSLRALHAWRQYARRLNLAPVRGERAHGDGAGALAGGLANSEVIPYIPCTAENPTDPRARRPNRAGAALA
jgi:hypothetical protein